MKQAMALWEVRLPAGRVALEITVAAPDKLIASKVAARTLGVSWKREARNMEIQRLRRADKLDLARYPGPATEKAGAGHQESGGGSAHETN